jgi:membrane protease subunit (stomatin/prohibitin family)
MAVLDLVKWDVPSDDFIVHKFMSENQYELRLGSQLVVNEGQEAIFVKGGVALDTFTAGTHTLVTGNLPLLGKLVNSFFGGKTPFTAEVWYVNKTVKRNMKWGTPQRIPLFDPALGFPINVGAFGQWGFRIDDSRSFVTQVVGAQLGADSKKIYEYFIGEIIEKFNQTVSNMISNGLSVFQLSSKLADISQTVRDNVVDEFNRFGIELVNFSCSSISISPEEMKKIQDVMAKKMEMQQLSSVQVGQGYMAAKGFEVMKDAANNNGAVGNMMGLGAGLGLAVNAGIPLASQTAQSVSQNNGQMGEQDVLAKLKKLKMLFEEGILTEEEYKVKKAAIIDQM